ncbi:unnamed protein product, partial [Mesorhabditis belari]|uniref:Uncharacterized protein n=1 Tax=Mesorhabditis belari TaxID=2138241 RepID=A0AAF3EXA7_9BILA
MFYACLATLICLIVGVTGIVLSLIDIERFNFGLYLALLSVVGSTVSIAFWIISPTICGNPRCVQGVVDRYGYKLDPIRNFTRRHFGQTRESRRKKLARRRKPSEYDPPEPVLEKRYRKKRSKRSRQGTADDSAIVASLLSQDRTGLNDSEEGLQTSSSGYHSPNQTVTRPSDGDVEPPPKFIERIVDETVQQEMPILRPPEQSKIAQSRSYSAILNLGNDFSRSRSDFTFRSDPDKPSDSTDFFSR